jgi:diguanylate cyclase (GGDEF)-like protein
MSDAISLLRCIVIVLSAPPGNYPQASFPARQSFQGMNRSKPKILIVDDQQFFIDVLLGLLTPNYRTSIAFNGEQAIRRAAADDPPDLILLDVLMPEVDGYEVCRCLKQDGKTRDIPVIFVTVNSDVNDEIKGFRLGAVDFITKPISPPIVQARIETHLALKRARESAAKSNECLEAMVAERTRDLMQQIAERQKAEERLRLLANYDQLTELPNRILFKDRLSQELKHERRSKAKAALLLIDLDRFKRINDTLGHYYGDRLLQQLASRLKRVVRDVDTVARLSGDEFTVILTGINEKEDAAVVAGKIILESREPFLLGKHKAHVSVSIGITCFPDDADDIDTMMKNADMAMYRAKKRGRNAYVFYTPCMASRVRERMDVEQDLRRAVAASQFVLHYQPIIELSSGNPIGVEALLRWQHPQRGLVFPSEFIPVADESDLTLSIGEWVLQTACKQANRWRSNGLTPLHLAINFSARQFNYNHRFLSIVENILAANGFPADQLFLEITEALLLDPADEAASNLRGLETLGVNLTIDDFGTGFSALGAIRRFSITTLKIDRSLIRDIAIDSSDAKFVTAIIDLARKLNINVIAEGVETEQQCHFLQTNGCGFAQGYYFSEPLPADEFERLFFSAVNHGQGSSVLKHHKPGFPLRSIPGNACPWRVRSK